MSRGPKPAPVVPVVGGSVVSSAGDREEQMRKWEEEQAQRRQAAAAQQSSSPATPQAPLAAVPAPATEASPANQPAPTTAPADGSPATPARVTATGYLPMPEFTEPDSTDPEARLEFYSRGILAVQYAARANHERAEQQRLIGLGLRLRAIKDEELHKTAGFDTFGDLTLARFGIRKHQANNIIRVLGVAQALEDITTQELKERPLRVLVPILDTHGADAVRETWLEASRHGNVTDTALKDAAVFLGYAPPKELPPVLEKQEAAKPAKAAVAASESLRAVERIRTLAQSDLEKARREAEQLESAVRELLEELQGNLD
jgi:hypothetical protein